MLIPVSHEDQRVSRRPWLRIFPVAADCEKRQESREAMAAGPEDRLWPPRS